MIKEYLLQERKVSKAVADKILEKLNRHKDILVEFEKWLLVGKYESVNAVEVEGYKASDIALVAPFLSGVGEFTFLVSLRENPEVAKRIIRDGFPRK